MNRIKLAILLSLALVPALVMAQNKISGTINDSETKEVLTGANIIIKNTTLGTASNKDGSFELSGFKNGDYVLRISFSGYETLEQKLTLSGLPVNIKVNLVPASIDLNAVVVTGTRSENQISSSPILTQLISKKLIEQRGVDYIPQILTSTDASFEMVKDNTVKSFKFDGLGPQYTLFLIDGERVAGETKGAVDLSRINPAGIERIEIIKGAASTLYGSNAIGGVVNIITKSVSQPLEISSGTKSDIYTDPSTDKTKADNYYFASVNFSQGKFSSFSDAKLNHYAPFDLNRGEGIMGLQTQEKETNYSLNQKLIFTASDKLLISARVSYYRLNRDFALKNYPDKISNDFTYGAKATYFTNKKSKLEFSWHSDKNNIYDVVAIEGGESKLLDYKNLLQNVRFLGNYNPGEMNKFTAGMEYLNEKQSSIQNNIEDKSLNNFVIYLQDEISLFKNFNVILGTRTDFHSNYGIHFTPQASTMFSPGNFKFRASFGQGFRAPTVKELFTDHFEVPAFGSPIAFFLEGNADLKPEKSNYYSASAQYANEKFDISLNYSENHIDNLINSDSIINMIMGSHGPTRIDYIYSNVEKAVIKSINLLAKIKITNSVSFTGSYTYTDPKNKTTDMELVNVRNHNARFNLDFHKRFNKYYLTANLNASYFGKKNVLDIYSHVRPQPRIELNDFTLFNLTTTHTFHNRYMVTLGVNNLLDKTDDRPEYFNFSSPGRTFVVGLSVTL